MKWGIGKGTIWNEVKGQIILGEDAFVERFSDHLRRNKDIPEIPKSQRYADRPALEKIFKESVLRDKRKRNRKIAEAIEKHGYTQRSIAIHLGVHFTYISTILRARGGKVNSIDPNGSRTVKKLKRYALDEVATDVGVRDLARNHDHYHYLYGAPKR